MAENKTLELVVRPTRHNNFLTVWKKGEREPVVAAARMNVVDSFNGRYGNNCSPAFAASTLLHPWGRRFLGSAIKRPRTRFYSFKVSSDVFQYCGTWLLHPLATPVSQCKTHKKLPVSTLRHH